MDLLHIGLLIRWLMLLGMICLFVIAGMLDARRDRRRASQHDGDASTSPRQRPVVVSRSRFVPTRHAPGEANVAEASAPRMERRAA
jgi:hypothetical protein